jgi:hypothetical protein
MNCGKNNAKRKEKDYINKTKEVDYGYANRRK